MMWYSGSYMSIAINDIHPWMLSSPDDDAVFTDVILPTLKDLHIKLMALDFQRGDDVAYVFHQHVLRVADMGRDFAAFMGAPEHAAKWYHYALIVHDCGKVVLPHDIWDSERKPSDDVKAQRRAHARLGGELLEQALPSDHPFTAFAADLARHHHEQMDGKGPQGQKAGVLSVWVRTACIVDSFDGMSIKRAHFDNKRDLSPAGVHKRIAEEKGPDQYDTGLVELFGKFLKVA